MMAFWKSLFAAILGGAISSAASVVSTGNLDAKHVGTAAATGAAIAIGALFHPSPIQSQGN